MEHRLGYRCVGQLRSDHGSFLQQQPIMNLPSTSVTPTPDQIPGSASQIFAGNDRKTKGKGCRKSVILAVVLTVLILFVLALVGAVVFLVLRNNTDNCDGSTSRGTIPPTANPLITAAPSTLVMANIGMYYNVKFKSRYTRV